MRAKQFLCFITATESRANIWRQLNTSKLPSGLGCCAFSGGGSVVHCFMCGGSVFGFALLFVLSIFCNHLDEEERAGCSALISFLVSSFC